MYIGNAAPGAGRQMVTPGGIAAYEGSHFQRHDRGTALSRRGRPWDRSYGLCGNREELKSRGVPPGITQCALAAWMPMPWRHFCRARPSAWIHHPYATEATRNICAAAAAVGVEGITACCALPVTCLQAVWCCKPPPRPRRTWRANRAISPLATGAKELPAAPSGPPRLYPAYCTTLAGTACDTRASTTTLLPCRGRLPVN